MEHPNRGKYKVWLVKTLSHYQLYFVGLPPLHVYKESPHDYQEGTDEIDY